MNIERRNYLIEDVEIRSEEGQPTILSGYAAVFDKLSVPLWGFREKIQKGAFANSIRKNNVRALWNHNSDFPLGSTKAKTLMLKEDNKGLDFDLELPDNSWGKDAAIATKRKDVEGMSFGFTVVKDEWDRSKKDNPIRTLVEVNLIEISLTPFPAYPATTVSARNILMGQGIDHDKLAEILVRSQNDILTEEDAIFIDSVIEKLQGLRPSEEEAKHSINQLKRRLELAEKLFI